MKRKLKKVLSILTAIVIIAFCAVSIPLVISMFKSFTTPAPTPDPDVPLTMDMACDYASQVVEVEGKLILPNQMYCTAEEPFTCQLYLTDPFRGEQLGLDVPQYKGTGTPPLNQIAELPDEYSRSDFYIVASGDRLARDGSFISIRGRATGRRTNCRLEDIESIRVLERIIYLGVDLTRVTLQEAIEAGLVTISIRGDGLTRVDISIKPKVELNLEVEVEPGTILLSGTEGVQNMVVRKREFIYLKPDPEVEVSLEVEVSCVNMHLEQPTSADAFTISPEPASEDLGKLLVLVDFPYLDLALQQFAIWTITDNPPDIYSFVGIDTGGHSAPLIEQLSVIRQLFDQAGIDTTKYLVFTN